MGAPSIYVYDCSNAAVIVRLFEQFAEQHEEEWRVSVLWSLKEKEEKYNILTK